MTKNNRITRLLLVVLMLLLSVMLMGSTMMDGEHHHELRAKLTGAAEVSGGDQDGKGQAKVTVMMDASGNHQVCWSIKVKNITLPATAAHIHAAPAGVNGSVFVPLSPPAGDGLASGCSLIAHELAMELHMHPEQYYVNVHTTDFPVGALRGQLFLAEE